MKEKIKNGNVFLGIELGSTRIKASLIDDTYAPVASGGFEWNNSFENGYWTYSLDEIHNGIKACFENLSENVSKEYGVTLKNVGAIGISAMMHGYLAFDSENNLLTPFRTWRNTTTKDAAEKLTELFNFNIPQRWSIAHLYQAILNNEAHISEIAHITTLSGYIHYLLSGKWELGIGDASGMFPITGTDYDAEMLNKFDELIKDKNLGWKLKDILPAIKSAGEKGTVLSEEGAKFLDRQGNLEAGIPLCAPEGDAGTGMVATNSVLPKTGNISAGTSVFSMLVLEKPLSKLYPQIDIAATPDGSPVAMVHCNNCCNELDTWVNIFDEFAKLFGINANKSDIYEKLYKNALDGNSNGIVSYNYLSGEHTTEVENGRPMYFRLPEIKMNLAGFMKAQIFSSFATLAIGMNILFGDGEVSADKFLAHGGLFKVEGVAQQLLASALKTPVSVMQTAGEGGAWGMALLAAYMQKGGNKKLGEWLSGEVFADIEGTTLLPDSAESEEFEKFLELYKAGLKGELALGEVNA